MSKRLAILIVITILLHLMVPPCAFARLSLHSPRNMIERSTLIVDATVVESTIEKTTYGSEQPVGKFKVNAVLKGDSIGQSFTVASEQGGKPFAFLQKIPSPGTRVMVLLSKGPTEFSRNASVRFIADDNNIAIIKDGKVVD
ncbi:MAG: hypothetical protein IBX64_02920, partial [Actinobacteria bacterium]|nr:hypothetical protein [Actinomycetota bacterium]